MARTVGEPRYRQVLESLRQDIDSGRYRPGQKLPSEAALVQQFATSRITVGRALQELKQHGLLTGKAGSGNYVNDPVPAASLLFGLLIPNLGETEIFEPICRGMASAPEAAGFALLWGSAIQTPGSLEEQALSLCRQFIKRRVSGVFFAPLEQTANKDRINHTICQELDDAQIPVVLLDRCIEAFPRRSKYDLVGIDNRRAGFLASDYLLGKGCLDVAFMALPEAAPTVAARCAGFREAMWARGVPLLPERVQTVDPTSPGSLFSAFQAAHSHSIVCANDRLACQFLRMLQEHGLRVPDDIRVIGIDDVEYAEFLPISLTTIRQPCRAIGEAAISAMLSRRANPSLVARDILLDIKLVVRESAS